MFHQFLVCLAHLVEVEPLDRVPLPLLRQFIDLPAEIGHGAMLIDDQLAHEGLQLLPVGGLGEAAGVQFFPLAFPELGQLGGER